MRNCKSKHARNARKARKARKENLLETVKNVKNVGNVRIVGNRRQEAFDPRKGLECKLGKNAVGSGLQYCNLRSCLFLGGGI